MRREYKWALILLPVLLLVGAWNVCGQAKDEEGAIVKEEMQVEDVAAGKLPKDKPAEEKKAEEKKAEEPAKLEVKDAPAAEAKAEVKEEKPAEKIEEKPADAGKKTVEELAAEALKDNGAKKPAVEEVVDKAAEDAFKDAAKEGIPARPNIQPKKPLKETKVEEPKKEEVAIPLVPAVEEKKVEPVAEKPAPAVEEKKEEPVAEKPAPAVEEKKAEPAAEKPAAAVEEKKVEPAAEEKKAAPAAGEAKAAEADKAEGGGEAAKPAAAEEKKEEAVALDPKMTEIILLKEGEVLRRAAYEKHAAEMIVEGEKALIERRHPDAVRAFDEAVKALKQVSERPENAVYRQRARKGLADAYYRYGIALKEQKDFKTATAMAIASYNNGHPKAMELQAQIEQAKLEPPPKPPKPGPMWSTEEYKKQQREIDQYMREGRQYFSMGEYEKAEERFGSVLRRDPENTEAIRYFNKIGQKKYDRATMELESTRKEMISTVRKTWNPRDYGVSELEINVVQREKGSQSRDEERKREETVEKMKRIKFPEIEFKQAVIYDVIEMLQQMSQEYDTIGTRETRGVNLVLMMKGAAAPAAAPAAEDGDAGGGAAPPVAPGAGEIPLINLKARNISLYEALKVVMENSGLKYKVDGNIVKIVRRDEPDDDLFQRFYDVMPDIADKLTKAGAEAAVLVDRTRLTELPPGDAGRDWKGTFARLGVPWPEGSSISHLPSIGKLHVVNTLDNLAKFEKVFQELNVRPNQIEIEARFVEVRQTDLNSLGFEWLLTDQWEIAQKKGQKNLPLLQRQRIVMPANVADGGFTSGLRFGSDVPSLTGGAQTIADGILTFSSVLTNPELSMILHALEQKGNADLLQAPKVTTKAGQEATIKAVTEYIYPTAYTVTVGQPPVLGANGQVVSPAIPPIVTPENFETRDVGVILQVTPQLTAEGNMIDLTMQPQVVSEPTWHNYGQQYYDASGRLQQLNMEQPFFHLRTVSTSVSIFNEATVVLGGMITELRNDVDDKIPLLGEIPLLGRLFRSKHEESEKRNLLIFVTARLVDPAGRPIKRREANVAKGETVPIAAPAVAPK